VLGGDGDGVGEDHGAGGILPTGTPPRVPVLLPGPSRAAARQAAGSRPADGGWGGRVRCICCRETALDSPGRDLPPLRPPLAPLPHRRRYRSSLLNGREWIEVRPDPWSHRM
jgi:hypothetical protein